MKVFEEKSIYQKQLSEFREEYNTWQSFMEKKYGMEKAELEDDSLLALALHEAIDIYKRLNQKNKERRDVRCSK